MEQTRNSVRVRAARNAPELACDNDPQKRKKTWKDKKKLLVAFEIFAVQVRAPSAAAAAAAATARAAVVVLLMSFCRRGSTDCVARLLFLANNPFPMESARRCCPWL